MGNGFIVVNKEDWEKTPAEQKDWLIFNTLQSLNERVATLETRFTFKTTLNFFGSVVGGAVMVLVLALCKIKAF
jgi:hypothetical protein